MESRLKKIAEQAAKGAAEGTMHFGQIVGTLMEAGFDGYLVDYRAATQTYALPDGTTHTVAVHRTEVPMASGFDAATVREAILEAQAGAEGYTYRGFCEKVVGAGCAGYLVSFPGRRILYFGRDGQTHTEPFPGT